MSKYYGIVFSVVIITFSILVIFLPKKDFSENENRYLAKFPEVTLDSITDGYFMTDLEHYIQDHFAFRDLFLNMKTYSELAMLKDENNNVYFAKNGYLIEKNTPINEANLDKIVRILNNLSTLVPNIHKSVLIVPTSITINNDLLPRNAINYSELEQIKYIYDRLVEFDKIELYDSLMALKNSSIATYYKLDHHWTTRAAYEAYVAYTTILNMNAINLKNFKVETVTEDFRGTTYSKANLHTVTPDKIETYSTDASFEVKFNRDDKIYTSMYFKEFLNMKDKYSMFLKSNQALIVVTNKSIADGKSLLVIKDSYANCFIPFIANNFKTVHIIDPRYYLGSISEYITSNIIDEVLVLYNIKTMSTDLGIYNIK